ncbi:MAG: hypothetical protein EPN49_00465 [Rhodanobacter sp.]|nr:MAG: hypothetical protein EPN49_00465 [Rhodanobacter sp.]
MMIRVGRGANAADYLLLVAVTLIMGMMAFHPYYFGDEILPFYFSYKPGATIWSIYSGLNEYKPRLIFNGIWAIAAYCEAPRYIFMLLIVGSIGSLAALGYHVARAQFATSRLVALTAGAIIITSRFSMVSYYDYVAGTIESLSALCFFLAVALVMAPKAFGQISQTWRVALAAFGCVLAVFIHERYMAGTIALGIVMMARSLMRGGRALDHKAFGVGLALSVVPVLLFVVAIRLQGSLPLTTGTNGTQIAISFGIIERALTYLGNVFLGINLGHQWLVGSLQFSGGLHIALIIGLACLFGLVYAFALTLGRKGVAWGRVMEITLLMAAFIGVASLPDASRQEGRWMTPALVLLVFLGMHLGRARAAYLLLLFVTNLTYLVAGSQFKIYNVEASRMASAVAAPLNRLRPEGSRGIVLNAPDNGGQWVLGGYGGFGNDGTSGSVFGRLNFASQIQVDPGVTTSRDHDFGLYYLGPGSNNESVFAYIGHRQLVVLQHPDEIAPDSGQTIAGQEAWSAWHWDGNMAMTAGAAELRSGVIGTLKAPASDLDHKLIVYRAKALVGNAVPMRIQINWADGRGNFIGAFIKVVDVGKVAQNFVAVVVAPAGAREGTVYANLHDGATGTVELSSIKLIGD